MHSNSLEAIWLLLWLFIAIAAKAGNVGQILSASLLITCHAQPCVIKTFMSSLATAWAWPGPLQPLSMALAHCTKWLLAKVRNLSSPLTAASKPCASCTIFLLACICASLWLASNAISTAKELGASRSGFTPDARISLPFRWALNPFIMLPPLFWGWHKKAAGVRLLVYRRPWLSKMPRTFCSLVLMPKEQVGLSSSATSFCAEAGTVMASPCPCISVLYFNKQCPICHTHSNTCVFSRRFQVYFRIKSFHMSKVTKHSVVLRNGAANITLPECRENSFQSI